ncbi:hypothetical protein ACHAXS_013731 [Conticribra weissflogii]
MSILSKLDLHPNLKARIHQVHHVNSESNGASSNEGFVLYLPTVCLRHEQNPAFAVACHAANYYNAPLVILAVVLDDSSHATLSNSHRQPLLEVMSSANNFETSSPSPSVVMTSRRLAFTLQALSHACELWSRHGAAVGIRIHGSSSSQSSEENYGNDNNGGRYQWRRLQGARTPDHLTLASRSLLVVTDEPFVSPYLTMVQKVEEACRRSNVECIRVDGSCTVPPVQVLKPCSSSCSKVLFRGVPAKAYMWQNQSEHLRESHLIAAMEGHFDAPDLNVKMEDEDLFRVADDALSGDSNLGNRLAHLFPSRWKPASSTNSSPSSLPRAPDVRPFTSRELSSLNREYDESLEQENSMQQHQPIVKTAGHGPTFAATKSIASKPTNTSRAPFHDFALQWPGADPTVTPCPHTIGTTTMGMQRWNTWVQNNGLRNYGQTRNDATKNLIGVSRMSCYLNLGIVSIFRIVWEVKRLQGKQVNSSSGRGGGRWNNKHKTGVDKFEEEIVKWREMSYAHAFSRLDYDDVGSLAKWSIQSLEDNYNSANRLGYGFTLNQLAIGSTGDAKWDAMQQYLVQTGELHNNVRMTWGKTVIDWGGCNVEQGQMTTCSTPAHIALRTLCYLNDRYALDGLSPPSYAGILWCMGWCDKPGNGGGISWKPANRYRLSPEQFQDAARKLMSSSPSAARLDGNSYGVSRSNAAGGQRSVLDMMKISAPGVVSSQQKFSGGCNGDTAIDFNKNSERKNDNRYPGSCNDTTEPIPNCGKRNAGSSIDCFFQRISKKTAN